MKYIVSDYMQNIYAFGIPSEEEKELLLKNGFWFFSHTVDNKEMWITDPKNIIAYNFAKERAENV